MLPGPARPPSPIGTFFLRDLVDSSLSPYPLSVSSLDSPFFPQCGDYLNSFLLVPSPLSTTLEMTQVSSSPTSTGPPKDSQPRPLPSLPALAVIRLPSSAIFSSRSDLNYIRLGQLPFEFDARGRLEHTCPLARPLFLFSGFKNCPFPLSSPQSFFADLFTKRKHQGAHLKEFSVGIF